MESDFRFLDPKDYYESQRDILYNLIEEEYPRYYAYLDSEWQGTYINNKDRNMPDDAIDMIAFSIANRKLRELYQKIDDSLLHELKTSEGYAKFEKYHFTKQKQYLLQRIKNENPESIEEAMEIWDDIAESCIENRTEHPDYQLNFPEYFFANWGLRKFYVHVKRNNLNYD
ncbi:MAG: hypothetical protein ACLFPQ_03600 [Candidatus Woesearchaeota archaeon]